MVRLLPFILYPLLFLLTHACTVKYTQPEMVLVPDCERLQWGYTKCYCYMDKNFFEVDMEKEMCK
jgi:hypothetical protein